MFLDRDVAGRQLQAAGRYLGEYNLTWGNAGNLSARTAPNRYVITASGARLAELGEADVVECALAGQAMPANGRKPSKEMPMHRAVYETRPEINAVLHAALFYSTLVACSAVAIPSDWFVEAMYYLERIGRVPYCHPGSEALGDAVRAQASEANILLLENHGVLVYDTTIAEALMALHTLEFTCHMIVTARSAQIQMRPIAPDSVNDFLHRSGYRPRREWPA
jgi:L-fuculose-phosphate aldolase